MPTLARLGLASLLLVACGKPVDDNGQEATFTKASMTLPQGNPADANRTLASEVGVELVAMVVMFDRLHTGDTLAEALNRKPGRLCTVDLDKDGTPDPLTVVVTDEPDSHAVEIRSNTALGEFVVITITFDNEWAFTGHFDGRKTGPASTYANPLPAAATAATVAVAATPSPPPAAPLPSSAPPAAAPTPAATP